MATDSEGTDDAESADITAIGEHLDPPPGDEVDAADDAETLGLATAAELRVGTYIPTPAEIAAAIAEIRAGWSDEERAARFVGPGRTTWRPPGSDQFGEIVPTDALSAFVDAGTAQPLGDVWGHERKARSSSSVNGGQHRQSDGRRVP